MRILVVSPWPDGPEMIAGTIVKEARLGHEIYILCLSKGGGHRSDMPIEEEERIRVEEQRHAAAIEGVKEVHFMNMKTSASLMVRIQGKPWQIS
jgi:LmbE family N-acetylglucosaminyl deacetylase